MGYLEILEYLRKRAEELRDNMAYYEDLQNKNNGYMTRDQEVAYNAYMYSLAECDRTVQFIEKLLDSKLDEMCEEFNYNERYKENEK